MAEEQKKKDEFSLVEIPTEFGLAVQTPEGENITINDLLIRIANDIKIMKKHLVGE